MKILWYLAVWAISFPLPAMDIFTFNGQVHQVDGSHCVSERIKTQGSPYSVLIYCDDALATNIAISRDQLGAPLAGPYKLNQRVWQNGEWGLDATSIAWLKANELIVATSGIYGTSALYRLDLDQQQVYRYSLAAPNNRIQKIAQDRILIRQEFGLHDEESAREFWLPINQIKVKP